MRSCYVDLVLFKSERFPATRQIKLKLGGLEFNAGAVETNTKQCSTFKEITFKSFWMMAQGMQWYQLTLVRYSGQNLSHILITKLHIVVWGSAVAKVPILPTCLRYGGPMKPKQMFHTLEIKTRTRGWHFTISTQVQGNTLTGRCSSVLLGQRSRNSLRIPVRNDSVKIEKLVDTTRGVNEF